MLPPIAAHPTQNAESTPPPRLVHAAHEFEAQLMKELLKPLSAPSGLTGSDDDSDSGGVLGQFAGEALGRAISEQGGFGIADGILQRLSHSGNRSGRGSVTGTLHSDTVTRPLQ